MLEEQCETINAQVVIRNARSNGRDFYKFLQSEDQNIGDKHVECHKAGQEAVKHHKAIQKSEKQSSTKGKKGPKESESNRWWGH